jgi:uncharacterized small protein (DUF1192 family)
MNSPAKKRVATKAVTSTSKKASKKPSAPAPSAAPVAAAPKSKNILTAGIKALTNAHEEAVARQSRVFESLLGLGQGRVPKREGDDKPNPLTQALDPFGIKKFEDVFDQRVARALQRLAVPSSEVVERLERDIAALRDEIARLRTQLAKR